MKPHVYQYQDPTKQSTFFRGYVKKYQGQILEKIACTEVRTNKAQAEKDAKKLMKKLKTA